MFWGWWDFVTDKEPVENVAAGVNRLADNVGELTGEVRHFRNRSQTDRLLFICLAIVLLAMAVLSYVEWRSDRLITRLARDGIGCLVEQNIEHRYSQGDSPISEQVREIREAVEEKCGSFVKASP